MFYNFILLIIMFFIKFIIMIIENYESASNGLVSILKVFWKFIIYNILRLTINKSRIKITYYIFLKDFINKYIHKSSI